MTPRKRLIRTGNAILYYRFDHNFLSDEEGDPSPPNRRKSVHELFQVPREGCAHRYRDEDIAKLNWTL
jgi:hypothetical protein